MATWTRSRRARRITTSTLVAGSILALACAGTLEDRAKAGDPEAQRKLGESFLSDFIPTETPSADDSAKSPNASAREREGAYWIREAAKAGDPIAQRKLAELYYRGQGVEKGPGEAARWSQSAAEQGDAEAQGFLAGLYRIGVGVPPDLGQSLTWYRKAAVQGHTVSQYHLGAAYDFGVGLPADRGRALLWYKRAADQGHHGAQYNLAVLYLTGDRARPSPAHGLKWLFIGSRTGSVKASERLLEVRDVYRPEDIRSGFDMAREWFRAKGVPDLEIPSERPEEGPGGAADGI